MIHGNVRAQERFQRILTVAEDGERSLALLLYGPDGIGKRTLALECAIRLAGHKSEVHVLPEFDEDSGKDGMLRVDGVRRVIKELESYPVAGDRKVLVLDRADYLNATAADALLKVIEDRPYYLWIFLIAERLDRVLPTVRSRVHPIYFGPLTSALVMEALPHLSQEVVAQSKGSPGLALSIEGGRAPVNPTWGSDVFRDLVKLSDFECMAVVDRMVDHAKELDISSKRTLRAFLDDIAMAVLTEWENLEGWGDALWAEVRRVMSRSDQVTLSFHVKTMLIRMRRIRLDA